MRGDEESKVSLRPFGAAAGQDNGTEAGMTEDRQSGETRRRKLSAAYLDLPFLALEADSFDGSDRGDEVV